MTDKIASFRIESKKWQDFINKAKGDGGTASGVLKDFIDQYLECTNSNVSTVTNGVLGTEQEDQGVVSTDKGNVLTEVREWFDDRVEARFSELEERQRSFEDWVKQNLINTVIAFTQEEDEVDQTSEEDEGLNDRQLADLLGKGKSTINRWRLGKARTPQDLAWEVRGGKWYPKG